MQTDGKTDGADSLMGARPWNESAYISIRIQRKRQRSDPWKCGFCI